MVAFLRFRIAYLPFTTASPFVWQLPLLLFYLLPTYLVFTRLLICLLCDYITDPTVIGSLSFATTMIIFYAVSLLVNDEEFSVMGLVYPVKSA